MYLTFLRSFALLACSTLFIPLTASAQLTEYIETDRPDQTETPFVAPRKYFQAEFGLNRETYKGNVTQYVHPASLLKYGLSNRLEVRLEATYLSRQELLIPQPKNTVVLEPVEIGTKIALLQEKGIFPKASLILHFGMPFIADKQYHADPVNFSARLSLQNSLSENLSLGYNIGIESGGGETAFFYTVAPGFKMGSRWYAYVEAFGSFSKTLTEHNIDGGVAFSVTKNMKLDLSSGFGLGHSLLQHYVALGFSFRMPLSVQ